MRQSYATHDAVSVVHDTEREVIDASRWQHNHSQKVRMETWQAVDGDGTEWLKLDGGVTTGRCGRGG